ncbi:hypothetical protein C5E09_04795 [Rathayibacter iranicus]|nr:hypothetical protein C5E09_04795 [Rathayibacter iranicus]PPI72617.1 hypothetical protein C5E01_04920 [Rathayibacter iranicus]
MSTFDETLHPRGHAGTFATLVESPVSDRERNVWVRFDEPDAFVRVDPSEFGCDVRFDSADDADPVEVDEATRAALRSDARAAFGDKIEFAWESEDMVAVLFQDMIPTEDLETDESGRPSVLTSNVMAREESDAEYQAFRAGATDWLITAMNEHGIQAWR